MTSLAHTHTASRSCIVCGKDLTDSASLEAGIGPVCRKKANEVLAREIPANIALAQTIAAALPTSAVPTEAQHTLSGVQADVAAGQTNDWRATVKRCAWLLSFSPTRAFQGAVVDLVAALGYVGLAGLLTGEASTGEANVVFKEGRLYLTGPKNKAGREAIKSCVKGWAFHPAAGADKASWSAPAAEARAFLSAVAKFWPLVEGVNDAADSADLWVEEHPAPVAPVNPAPSGKVTVTKIMGGYQVVSPWNPGFVAAVKKFPYGDRRWNATAKAWEVNAVHADHLRQIIKACYGESPALLG